MNARIARLRLTLVNLSGPLSRWLDRIDLDRRKRLRGVRMVASFSLAVALALLVGPHMAGAYPASARTTSLALLAGGFALWASAQDTGRATAAAAREILALCLAATLGASVSIVLDGEWSLVLGALLAGGARRRGGLVAALASQFFIGQLLACAIPLQAGMAPLAAVAGVLAAIAAVLPRLLSGAREKPSAPTVNHPCIDLESSALEMALQAAMPVLLLVAVDRVHGLLQPEWAMAAAVYVIASTRAETRRRCRRRVVGTAIGVLLALLYLPLAWHLPLLAWLAAAVGIVAYAMATPARYDVACGACSFTLVCLLAGSGEHSLALILARIWETGVGTALGLLSVSVVHMRQRRRGLGRSDSGG